MVATSQLRDPLKEFSCVFPVGPNEPDAQIGMAYQTEKDFRSIAFFNVGC
jgi:hypothetical protein